MLYTKFEAAILIPYGNISEFLLKLGSTKMEKALIFGQTDFPIRFGAAMYPVH